MRVTDRACRGAALAALALACVVLAGCAKGPDMAPVTGRVAYRGKPLVFGTVMFQHVTGGQPAIGDIQPDGSYRLSVYGHGDGARVGANLVRVTCFEGNDPAKPMKLASGEPVLGKSLIPRKYSSFGGGGLRAEVKPAEPQVIDFELLD